MGICSFDEQPCAETGVWFEVSGFGFRVSGRGFSLWEYNLSTSSPVPK